MCWRLSEDPPDDDELIEEPYHGTHLDDDLSTSNHRAMIDAATLEKLKRMTPGERLAMGMNLLDIAWGFLMHLPAEERLRRLQLARPAWNPPPGPMQE
jgi:hypothetical protein